MTTYTYETLVGPGSTIQLPQEWGLEGEPVQLIVSSQNDIGSKTELISDEKLYTADDVVASLDGILAGASEEAIESARLEYLLQKYA